MINRDLGLMNAFSLTWDAEFWSDQHEKNARRLRDTVSSNGMMGVVGSFGSGKSFLVRKSLSGMKGVDMVYVNNPDRERLRIGSIINAIIAALSEESPRRDYVARTTQAARIVGERYVNMKRRICVVVENAHRLHANTLMALKDLRESCIYKGYSPLFSVLLVGQSGLQGKLDRYGEVKYRTRNLKLNPANGWFTAKMRHDYVTSVYGKVVSENARKRLVQLYQTPLELDYRMTQYLEDMRAADVTELTSDMVSVDLATQMKLQGVSLGKLAKASGVPKSTVMMYRDGEGVDPNKLNALQAALDEMAGAASIKPELAEAM